MVMSLYRGFWWSSPSSFTNTLSTGLSLQEIIFTASRNEAKWTKEKRPLGQAFHGSVSIWASLITWWKVLLTSLIPQARSSFAAVLTKISLHIYRDVRRCHSPGDYSQCLERILLNEPITTLWNGGGNVWCNLVISNSFLPVNLIVFEEVFWLMIVFAVSYVDVLDLTHARFTCMLCKICKYGSFCGILMYFVVGYPNIQVSTTCIMYIDMIYLFIYLYIFFVFQERWRKYKYTLARYRCLHHLWQYN